MLGLSNFTVFHSTRRMGQEQPLTNSFEYHQNKEEHENQSQSKYIMIEIHSGHTTHQRSTSYKFESITIKKPEHSPRCMPIEFFLGDKIKPLRNKYDMT